MAKINRTIPFFLFSILLFSCGENKTVTISNTMQDEAKFAAALDGSEYTATSEMEGSQDSSQDSDLSAPAYQGAPEYIPSFPDHWWWRSALSRTRSLSDVTYTADSSSASVKVAHTLSGTLNLYKLLLGNQTKSWTMAGYRMAYFNLGANGKWRLTGLSPLVLKSANNTIEIEKVKITQGANITEITNPYNITTLANVPRISRNELVKVEVTLNVSSGTAFLFSHTGFRRQIMSDDGASSPLYLDAVAGNKTFTVWYYIGGPAGAGTSGIKRIVFDAISRDTLNNRTNGTYNNCVWILPYLVL